jgi:hypothetical protein
VLIDLVTLEAQLIQVQVDPPERVEDLHELAERVPSISEMEAVLVLRVVEALVLLLDSRFDQELLDYDREVHKHDW